MSLGSITTMGKLPVAIVSSPVTVIAVSPAVMPVTTPVPSTVAMEGSSLLKV